MIGILPYLWVDLAVLLGLTPIMIMRHDSVGHAVVHGLQIVVTFAKLEVTERSCRVQVLHTHKSAGLLGRDVSC